MNDVYVIKLITGEEVLSKIESEDTDLINLDSPMLISYLVDPQYGRGMILYPYMICSKDNLFTLYKKHVIFKMLAEESSADYYIKSCEKQDSEDDTIQYSPTNKSLH